jgi:hypothetical protein
MAEGEREMKNFKVVMKTDRKNCPLRMSIYNRNGFRRGSVCELTDYEKMCTEKNCPYKEGKK